MNPRILQRNVKKIEKNTQEGIRIKNFTVQVTSEAKHIQFIIQFETLTALFTVRGIFR